MPFRRNSTTGVGQSYGVFGVRIEDDLMREGFEQGNEGTGHLIEDFPILGVVE